MEYTEEQVQEMVREAVEKTERSFGGTFKRLKAENEELLEKYGALREENETGRTALEQAVTEKDRQRAELAIRLEISRQLVEEGPLPARFVPVENIPYSEDPEELQHAVTEAIAEGRTEFEAVLREAGITMGSETRGVPNPTNPAGRDSATGRDIRANAAREALRDMAKRGLLR
jgi:hypothetical protein